MYLQNQQLWKLWQKENPLLQAFRGSFAWSGLYHHCVEERSHCHHQEGVLLTVAIAW
ncbi:MAG: hypothetical protein LDL41_03005 [Coleofasciculus sp. S288]|nr:hypothetical protein [Coleofasciculus sp. S288]